MLEHKDLTVFTLNGNEYPIKCDLLVMEKIQNKTGDLLKAEDQLRGYVPSVDSDGVIDRTIGNWTLPDISLVCDSLVWMIEEGKAVTGGDYDVPTAEDLKRQDEYTVTQLAVIAFTEFEYCIGGKKRKPAQKPESPSKKTDTRTRTARR